MLKATVHTTGLVRFDYDDYLIFTEAHRDGAYELIDGAIYAVPPEGDSHGRTRSGVVTFLSRALREDRYTAYTELSFRAPG